MEVYTPSTYISQSQLEEYSGVSKGRYTIGLGQEGMGICGDNEDVNSLALTVVHSLLEKYQIPPSSIGRLEIGTETLVDKSKSTKTHLLPLFHPNTDIEGATIINACYGGTAALLNAFHWVESDGWDGRYAIVVAVDIAVYERGPARPTGGAGAVAVLVGRDAPLAFDPRERVMHATHCWDFYKPDGSSEYPTVDGALSQVCYYQALDDCYTRFADKMEKLSGGTTFDANSADYFVFHSPYNKLVQKSYGRMFLLDAMRRQKALVTEEEKKTAANSDDPLRDWAEKDLDATYADKSLEKVLKNISSTSFKKRLEDANYASKHVGNTYTASVFLGLSSLIDRVGGRDELTPGKSIVLFSYGSGALASMYRLKVRTPNQTEFTIPTIASKLSLTHRLSTRELVHPSELDHALETRVRMLQRSTSSYTPLYPSSRLFPGTYYLTSLSPTSVRSYARVRIDAVVEKGGDLAPPSVLRAAKREEVSTPVTKRVACVISGVAAGLPGGRDGSVEFGQANLEALVTGQQCIAPISDITKQHLVAKNVVQIKKSKDGTITRHPVISPSDTISLAAQIGSVNLSLSYGIPPSLAETMDKAAQVAVAAGFEALKDAGLVSGRSNTLDEWKLPEELRDGTGVVYASSFPAMDAAVGEVMRFLQSQTVEAASSSSLISALRERFRQFCPDNELSPEDEAAFARLSSRSSEELQPSSSSDYEFDRKFLFRVLVLGNAQLAQMCGCRGPNTQTNAACAGTTQAIAMAQDMLISGRADRIVVIAGDNASGDTLLPWIGSGFRALGAASVKDNVAEAALPFDKRRNGLLLGAGAIGMVLESEAKVAERGGTVKARLLATQYSNSAFHGASLCRNHIAKELDRFLNDVEIVHGINRVEIATNGVYLSHETMTHASPAQSCAGNEISAMRDVFGEELMKRILILNTKGFTGHPMGVSFEDVAAVQILITQMVPPIVNYGVKDDYLGDLNLSRGGAHKCRYALRFAAGFGSQVAFALYATSED